MTATFDIRISALDRDVHDRARFACGNAELDAYLKTQAGQDIRRRVAAVFVATLGDAQGVVGYHTLSQGSIRLDVVPPRERKRLPRYPDVPVTLLGRLAVDSAMKGRGLGARLLGDACHRAASIAPQVASTAVIVDAIDDPAIAFYEKFGFLRLPESPNRLMLPMATIVSSMDES